MSTFYRPDHAVGSFHWLDHAYTPFTPGAVKAVAMLVPVRAHMWLHEPAHLGGAAPAVLGFACRHFTPALHVRDRIPAVDVRPFEQFYARHAKRMRLPDDEPPGRLEESEAELVRCLTWLSGELAAPVSYWHHEGDHGLIHEFVWGFAPGSKPMTWLNADQVVRGAEARNEPASGFTAALWHLGVRCANRDETSWMHDPPGLTTLTERPFLP